MAKLKFEIPEIPDEQIKDLLIGVLSENDFDGFEETPTGLIAYIDNDLFTEEKIAIIHNHNLSYSKTLIEDQNWNAVWESNFEPVVVDDFVCVRAAFHEPVKEVEYDIIITPKMSFGTGHHATTYLVMQQMRKIDFVGKRVFDFGTGTGILAILAEKLGAHSIVAIDNDDWSIDNAIENIANNECSNIVVEKEEVIPVGTPFNIILANINKNVILQHLQSLHDQLKKNGIFVLSGLLLSDEQDIVQALQSYNFQQIEVHKRGEWICVYGVKL